MEHDPIGRRDSGGGSGNSGGSAGGGNGSSSGSGESRGSGNSSAREGGAGPDKEENTYYNDRGQKYIPPVREIPNFSSNFPNGTASQNSDYYTPINVGSDHYETEDDTHANAIEFVRTIDQDIYSIDTSLDDLIGKADTIENYLNGHSYEINFSNNRVLTKETAFDIYLNSTYGIDANDITEDRDLAEKLSTVKIKLLNSQPSTMAGREGRNIGLGAVQNGESALGAGDNITAEFDYHIALSMLDVALDFVPVVGTGKAIYEVVTGKSLLTGESLSTSSRFLAGVFALTMGLGPLVAAGKNTIKAVEALRIMGYEGQVAGEAGKTFTTLEHILSKTKFEYWETSEAANAEGRALGREPSWQEKGSVIGLSVEEHMELEVERGHFVKELDGKYVAFPELAPSNKFDFASTYAVPIKNLNYKSKVLLPGGTKFKMAFAASNKFGKGGGLQVYLEKDLSELNYKFITTKWE